jgi:hypothetical protein
MKKAAIARAQQRARRSGSASEHWWLTVVRKTTCCARCARILREGRDEMVFRKLPLEALCVLCADREQMRYRPSARWEQSRKVKVRKGAAWMREREAA